MKSRFSLANSLDIVAALIAAAAVAGVLQSFVIGKHYVIPTGILFFAVIFMNLARFGLQNKTWAKHMLFWVFFMFACHAFFALFWAAKPREILGAAFPWLYGGFLLLMIGLLIPYAKQNGLFGKGRESERN